MSRLVGVIDRARCGDVSESIWQHLYHYEVCEGDGSRGLTGAEIDIVMQVFRDYTVLGKLTVYGAEKAAKLCERVSEWLDANAGSGTEHELLVASLICVRALHAEICKERDANFMMRAGYLDPRAAKP